MGRHLPKLLRDDEPERLLRATRTERDRLLCMVLLYLGLRVAELVHLAVGHVDISRRVLRVDQGKGGKDRCLPIPTILLGPLRGWIGARRDGPLFPSPRGGHLTTRAIQLLVKRMAVRAGLHGALEPRAYHPHALRHVCATRMLERGADINAVSEMLGHSSAAVTSVYLHTSPERLRAAMEI